MSKPIIKEKIKSISLVVLFLSTVLLLYFFWGNISFGDLSYIDQPSKKADVLSVKDVIQPDRIVVNFGAENYTLISPENMGIWYNSIKEDSIIAEFDKFGQTENVLVEEINYYQYSEVMTFRSIRAEFNYYLPFSDFCAEYKIKKPQSYDAIEGISAIGYSEGKSESLFIYDGKNQKYYMLVAKEDNTKFKEMIAAIEAEGYNTYYPATTYLGVENNTLIPLDIQTNMKSFHVKQDSYNYQTEKINQMAELFFGENFDFVRKITEDNGKIIYMYGYGQNVLIANDDGSFEYKEERSNDKKNQQNQFDALRTALEFAALHGSYESLEGAKMKPYLKKIIVGPDKETGYRFIFGMEINGSRLYYENNESITVDVILGQVTYYKRNMIDFNQQEVDAIKAEPYEKAFSAINMIAKNYEYIYDVRLANNESQAATNNNNMFEDVASRITNIKIGYVKMEDSGVNSHLQPAWIVSLEGTDIYFDLYTAEPVGYSQE